VRLVLGPAAYWGNADLRALGFQLHSDVLVARAGRLGVLAWANAAMLPNYFGAGYRSVGVGLGARFE
jgi:hypothetical protein